MADPGKTASPAADHRRAVDTVVWNFRLIGTHIDRPARKVYDYAPNPANLSENSA